MTCRQRRMYAIAWFTTAIWVAALLNFAYGGAINVSASSTVVEAAGTTVIAAEGTKGIRLWLPSDSQLTKANIGIEIRGEHAFVGISTLSWDAARCQVPELTTVCMAWQVWDATRTSAHSAHALPFPIIDAPNPAVVYARKIYDIYLVSDAPLVLTLHFPGLRGSRLVTARGQIRGEVASIPVTCLDAPPDADPGCKYYGHGAIGRTMPPHSLVAGVQYAWTGQWRPPSFEAGPVGGQGGFACVLPSPQQPGGDPTPSHHPQGCPIDPTGRDRSDWNSEGTADVVWGAVPNQSGASRIYTYEWAAAQGPECVGFVAYADSYGGTDAGFGGWAVFLTVGIR